MSTGWWHWAATAASGVRRSACRQMNMASGEINCTPSDSRVLIGQRYIATYSYVMLHIHTTPQSARAMTSRLPAGGTRAHPIEDVPLSPVARWSTPHHQLREEIARRHRAPSERHATRTPPRTHRHQREHPCEQLKMDCNLWFELQSYTSLLFCLEISWNDISAYPLISWSQRKQVILC